MEKVHTSAAYVAKPIYAENAVNEIQSSLNSVLANTFALYFKTKTFHWHISGSFFRDYHLLFDEQANAIFASTDLIAERVMKIGGETLLSINQAAEMTIIEPCTNSSIADCDMLYQLLVDNKSHWNGLVDGHAICSKHRDFASTSLLETLIDESEKRIWFLDKSIQTSPQPSQSPLIGKVISSKNTPASTNRH